LIEYIVNEQGSVYAETTALFRCYFWLTERRFHGCWWAL